MFAGPRVTSRLLQVVVVLLLSLGSSSVFAQTTQFTYQGLLNDGGSPANGLYDLQFKLYDTIVAGVQQGPTRVADDLPVSNGIFTVTLNFGIAPFSGGDRWLEISVRPGASTGAYTTLSPRQQLNSTPYAVRSLNATAADSLSAACASCVTSGQINSINGSQVSGEIPVASVPGGSGSYIQNTTTQQATSNFNISGNGTAGGTLSANLLNAVTQFNLGGSRVLSTGPATGSNNFLVGLNAGNALTNGRENTFIGSGAGQATMGGVQYCSNCGPGGTPIYYGSHNAFVGYRAGASNSTGWFHAFFGNLAGFSNTTSFGNSFFGATAGFSNTTGGANSFFGSSAGYSNTTGGTNSFFGTQSGFANTTGDHNSFFGSQAGGSNTTGYSNSFFGTGAGYANTIGYDNSLFGIFAGNSNTGGYSNSLFGASAGYSNTSGSYNSFFGFEAGYLNTTGGGNSFFGTRVGESNTTGGSNSFFGFEAGAGNTTGNANTFFGWYAGASNKTGFSNTMIGYGSDVGSDNLTNATAIGYFAQVEQSNSLVLGSINGHNGATADTNVGIGTTTPTTTLYVQSTRNTGGENTATFRNATIGANSSHIHYGATGDWYIRSAASAGKVVLQDIGGNVGIGTSAPADRLHVAGDIRIGTGTTGCVKDADGTVITGTCSSDLRFKRDITPFPHLLDKLTRLQPVHFYWRQREFPDRQFGARLSYGLVAQEVAQVLPELVREDEQGFKAVDYAKLPLLSLQAIKELKAESEALKRQLEQQQTQLATLRRALCRQQPQEDFCRTP